MIRSRFRVWVESPLCNELFCCHAGTFQPHTCFCEVVAAVTCRAVAAAMVGAKASESLAALARDVGAHQQLAEIRVAFAPSEHLGKGVVVKPP